MPAINASRHHGLLDLPALRKRAKRLLTALKNHEADDTREQLRTLGPVSYTHLDVYKRQSHTLSKGRN